MPIKYVPFIPEPVEGQAVLANFNRVLKYRGADDTKLVLQRGMPYYEVAKQETVGDNTDGNMVIRGECVSACAYLKEMGITVDLVYIDPPFASGADYAKKVYVRRNPKVAEAIAQAEQELDIDELKAFEETMYGDVWSTEKYLNWMYENLMAIKSVMSETASIFVHIDWHKGHYVKILMDEIFGENNFINEIIWGYKDVGGGRNNNFYKRKHDNIFWYSKSENYNVFEIARTELSESTLSRFESLFDENGDITYRRFKELRPTEFESRRKQGRVPDNLDEIFLSKEHGRQMEDYWIDINPLRARAQKDDPVESMEYSTQKPEALLERIIKTAASEGMLVADFFGGSGVTAAVAGKLGRKFITSDIGLNAIQTIRDRLKANSAAFDVLEIKDGVSLYRNPVQTMEKIKTLIPGLKNEDSLDSFWEGAISDSALGTVPVYVPNLMDSSSKLLDTVSMKRIIHQAIPELPGNVKKVIVYYIDITDKDEIRKFIADDDSTTVEIELRDLKAVLDDVVVEDYAEFHVDEVHEDLFGGYVVTIDKFVSDRVLGKLIDYNNKCLQNDKKGTFQPIEISEEGLETIEWVSVDCTAGDGEWHSDSEIKIDGKTSFVIRNGQKTREFWDCTIRSEKKPLRLKIRNICGDESEWTVE